MTTKYKKRQTRREQCGREELTEVIKVASRNQVDVKAITVRLLAASAKTRWLLPLILRGAVGVNADV